MFRQYLSHWIFDEPICVNTDTLVYTPLLLDANEAVFHRHFSPHLVTILNHPNNDASYPWKRMVDARMELFVTCNNDRYITDHRRWGLVTDTMT